MNLNPFKKLSEQDNERDRHKKEQHRIITEKAKEITKNMLLHRDNKQSIKDLELLYKNYFKKYPDIDAEKRANERIVKLKHICN